MNMKIHNIRFPYVPAHQYMFPLHYLSPNSKIVVTNEPIFSYCNLKSLSYVLEFIPGVISFMLLSCVLIISTTQVLWHVFSLPLKPWKFCCFISSFPTPLTPPILFKISTVSPYSWKYTECYLWVLESFI